MTDLAERPVVRRVRPPDWPALRGLRLEALADTPIAFVETLEQARALDDAGWQGRAARGADGGDCCQLLAFAGERAVATAVTFVEGGAGWLAAVYVSPAWRGRGLLAEMLAGCAAWAGGRGQPHLRLEVHEDNVRARAAYARLGFVDTGVRRPYPLDRARQEHLLQLDLGSPGE